MNNDHHLTVMFDTRRKQWEQNPYISQLAASLEEQNIQVKEFSWRTLLLGRLDLFHVHWPEYLLRDANPIFRVCKTMLFAASLARIHFDRIPVIRTQHNLTPHDRPNRLEDLLLRALDSHIKEYIWLTPCSNDRRYNNDNLVKHGSYFPWLTDHNIEPRSKPRKSGGLSLLTFGTLKPYKGIEDGIRIVNTIDKGKVSKYEICGSPGPISYLERLSRLAKSDPRVLLIPERQSDIELVSRIQKADIVYLPYNDLYNSGVLFLALSLYRPVLIRRNTVAKSIQSEFGKSWVFFDDENWIDKFAQSNSAQTKTVHFDVERSWSHIGSKHAAIYRKCIRV